MVNTDPVIIPGHLLAPSTISPNMDMGSIKPPKNSAILPPTLSAAFKIKLFVFIIHPST